MRDLHRLEARTTDKGDYDAVDIVNDTVDAIRACNLTERQREALRLYYGQDMRQIDVANEMGVTQHTVSALLGGARRRLAKYLKRIEMEESDGAT